MSLHSSAASAAAGLLGLISIAVRPSVMAAAKSTRSWMTAGKTWPCSDSAAVVCTVIRALLFACVRTNTNGVPAFRTMSSVAPSADLPFRTVVRIGGHDLVGVQVQGVALQSEDSSVRRRRLPTDDLRHPGACVLAVVSLLAQMRLPESVQQRLRKPRHQGAARLRGGAEDGLSEFRLDKVPAIKGGVPEIRIAIAMRELQARQASRQMSRQLRQSRQVENKLGHECRFAMSAQRVFQAVGLRRLTCALWVRLQRVDSRPARPSLYFAK